MGGDLLALLDDLVGGVDDRLAADRERARAVGAHAHRRLVGVAVDDLDVLERHAELVDDELRKGRLVPLAVAVGAGHHLADAGMGEADLGALPKTDASAERADHGRRRDAAGLDVAGEADAAELALGLRSGTATGKVGVVRKLQRLVEMGLVVAGVVGERHRRVVGELVRLDEVLTAQLRRIPAELLGRRFDDGLEQIGRLGPTSAAIGVDRCGIGVHRIDRAMDRRRLVLTGEQGRVEIGRHAAREGREIGAHIGLGVHLERGEVAVRVHRQLGMGDMVPAVGVGRGSSRCAPPST